MHTIPSSFRRRSALLHLTTMPTFSLLPLGFFFVCFGAALRSVEAKQQKCQLRANNNQAPLLSGMLPSTSSSTSITGLNLLPTPTSSGGVLPSATPFNYGTSIIRGVNLYVYSLIPPSQTLIDGTEVDGLC